MKTRHCWYREQNWNEPEADWKLGLFHQWGTEQVSIEENAPVVSVAIIEDEKTHKVVTVYPWNVHFGTTP